MLYHLFFRLIFTRFDPETAHHLGVFALKAMKATGLTRILRAQQVIDYSRGGLEPIADLVNGFAKAEGLPAHGEAIKARFETE